MPSTSSPATPSEPALPPHPPLDAYYGDEQERRRRLDRWFDGSAPHYDRISQLMSLGSGSRYRGYALIKAGLGAGMSALDVACGSGVLARHAQRIVGRSGSVAALDPSFGMLQQTGRNGVATRVRGVAEALPFADERFDFLSMGYALRHVPDLRVTFEEYRRVLRPGGRLLILEITPPRSRVAYRALELYMGRIVPLLARVTGGRVSEEVMAYYWETIDRCVPPPVILEALESVGFNDVARSASMGVFSEYVATR